LSDSILNLFLDDGHADPDPNIIAGIMTDLEIIIIIIIKRIPGLIVTQLL
tara:strand:+ start:126 stop:275 length:150 start_codon:yes stop_codon:yes gene_type:complete